MGATELRGWASIQEKTLRREAERPNFQTTYCVTVKVN
jgi:hypothetical protein